jgi:hypothetical protein
MARTPEEKLAAVVDAYLSDIIPGIQRVYQRTNRVRESFILAHCAILSLSGFYVGTKDTGGPSYRKFVEDFFPSAYNPIGLWRDLRNSLIHAYTLTSTYVLAHKHSEKHLSQERNVKSERTGKRSNLTYLNFEDFFDDLRSAAQSYFAAVRTDPDLISRLCARYDVAAPATYISDKQIAKRASAQTQHEPRG